MNTNKLVKNVLWDVSAFIGFVVAEGIYRAGISLINKRELIGDGEVISEEMLEEGEKEE